MAAQLTQQQRADLVNMVEVQKIPAAQACRQMGVSRFTYYRWKARQQNFDRKKNLTGRTDLKIKPEAEEKILQLAQNNPEYTKYQLASLTGVGAHGVYNVLRRSNVDLLDLRRKNVVAVAQPQTWEHLVMVVVALELGVVGLWVWGYGLWVNQALSVGNILASIALGAGAIFLVYSLKYYGSLVLVLSFSQGGTDDSKERVVTGNFWSWVLGKNEQVNRETKFTQGMSLDVSRITVSRYPKVSVQIPFYNERTVVVRALEAAVAMDYPEYEVVLADDSTDVTSQLVGSWLDAKCKLEYATSGPDWSMKQYGLRPGLTIRHIHRTNRNGFKGGALGLALSLCDPDIEFVCVFDVDFVPYSDTVINFLRYFEGADAHVAAVQGYQWHVLNKSENWITRGVRTEYAGSYVIERAAGELYGGLKQISGSVYMIRRAVLQSVGWGKSITEDFELTLKLYDQGYKVIYSPYIQAPAECVSTIRRLIRQRMRWAEGHSFNIKKMWSRLMFSPKLTWVEKGELVYLAPYYLQAAFFVVGTFAWLLAEVVFRTRLPFWTEVWGWSLVLTNMLALPLMNGVGVFLEEGDRRDYIGLLAFVVLSYIVVPFQAYAAIKGFIEQEEGPWFRTPKTGRITDLIKRAKFYHWVSGLFGGTGVRGAYEVNTQRSSWNTWSGFGIKPVGNRRIGRVVLAAVMIVSLVLTALPWQVPVAYATNPSDTKWYIRDQDVGVQLIGNNDNTGKSIQCLTAADCKIAYHDETNGYLMFYDCDDANCYTGTSTAVDVDNDAEDLSIHCPTATDCKIAYFDQTDDDLFFYDCDNATCSSGTRTLLDGNTGCSLTDVAGDDPCDAAVVSGHYPSIFCPAADDCKIAYRDEATPVLNFADCANATCSSGRISTVDLAAGCSLTGCDTASGTAEHVNMYCVAADDCKIAVKDGSGDDLRFEDCDDEFCNSGNSTLIDGNTGCVLTGGDGCSTGVHDAGRHVTIFCPSSTNCKLAYADNTNTSVRFADCDDAECSTGAVTYLDGETGCSTGCTSGDAYEQPAIYCVAADDCKIAYNSTTNRDLRFIDCTNDACDAGSYNLLDGSASCVLTNCEVTNREGTYSSIYCPATDDCKIEYYDWLRSTAANNTAGNLKFADCANAACSSGITLIIDGNKMINGTTGAVTVNKLFGTSVSSTVQYVTNVEYPSGSTNGSLGTGDYNLKIYFTNSIATSLVWAYEVGYCTIASDCGTRTAHVTSANQSWTSGTTSPQTITVNAGSSLSVPTPAEANWLYVRLSASTTDTGAITINMNNTAGNNADSYVEIPALTVSEKVWVVLPLAVIVPFVVRWRKLGSIAYAKR